MQPDRTTDKAVIKAVCDGDINAFSILVDRYADYIGMIVSKHVPRPVVAEVSQEVFIRASRGLQKFRGDSSLKSWFSAIAVRTCKDYWRKHYRNREIPNAN